MKRLLGGLAALLAVTGLVVAPEGSDAASVRSPVVIVKPGGGAHSLQNAVDTLKSKGGGTIMLRNGRYQQRVKFEHAHNITIEPYRKAHAILDGTGLKVPNTDSGLITVVDSSNITVRGLDITGYRTRQKNHVPIGIYVHGHDKKVHLIGNHVHDMGNDNNTLGSFSINAHGIAAYGDDAGAPITGLVITRNTVDSLHLGASESVVVNGNVTHWQITHNNIHDNDNIGIDAIGFEPTLGGKHRYTVLNRARHGVIAHNVVARIKSQGNPAYWEDGSWCDCADGIYIDGGTRIRVQANRVSDSDIGIEVAAENGRGNASHVITSHNHVTGSLYTGISTGGYCDGHNGCGGVQTGKSFDNVFRYNTLRGNNRLNDGSPELLIQYHAHNDVFVHNSITATNTDSVAYGTVPRSDSSHNRSDHNTFGVVGGTRGRAQFGWGKHTYTGYGSYRSATGQDAHSTFR
jgi:hypothetical protein